MRTSDREQLAGFTKEKLKKHLTIKNLNEKGEYDLINNFTQQMLVSKGKLVSCPVIKIYGESYSINRLAYILFYGEIPSGECVSYKNGDKKDYRVKNLIAGTTTGFREIKKKAGNKKMNKKSIQSNFDDILEEPESEQKTPNIGTKNIGVLEILNTGSKHKKTEVVSGNYVIDESSGNIYLVCKNYIDFDHDLNRKLVDISTGDIYTFEDVFGNDLFLMKKIRDPKFSYSEVE